MGLFKRAKKWVDAGEDWGLRKNGEAGTAVITAAKKTALPPDPNEIAIDWANAF